MFHKSDGLNDEALKELKMAFKPSLSLRIFSTLTFIAPYLHLLLDILDENYTRLLNLALISAPFIAYITFLWTSYFYNMKKYREEINSYLRDPENYPW